MKGEALSILMAPCGHMEGYNLCLLTQVFFLPIFNHYPSVAMAHVCVSFLLNSLIILNISGCSRLCRLPDGLKEIQCLKELHANDTAIDELPSFIFYLDNLKVLSFAGCQGPPAMSTNWFPFNWMFGGQSASTGFRLPTSFLSLHSLKYLNLSYCNLSEESIPNYFHHLSSLKSLDLTGNNFVIIPSSISKLSRLRFLCLNWCEQLQLLPELPSRIMQLDASNCDSLETRKFDPIESFMKGRCLPATRFDMLIPFPGDEIPSWCVSQGSVSWAKVHIPNNLPQDEWVGFALCFQLVSYTFPPELCNHEIDCYLFSPNGKQLILISTRRLPPMDPCYPHLYILYLSIEQFRDKILQDDYWDGVEFSLKCYCCHSLRIFSSGCRLVCKQVVEVFQDQTVVSP